MSGPEESPPDLGWEAFRAARERFFARVRPEAMEDPPESACPEAVPEGWTRQPRADERSSDGGTAGP